MKMSYVFNDRLGFSIGSGTALGRAVRLGEGPK